MFNFQRIFYTAITTVITFIVLVITTVNLQNTVLYGAGVTVTQNASPTLVIPSDIQLNPAISPIVKVPIFFHPNGSDIVGAGFSIQYDDTCLALIDTDVDNNGILDGVNLMVGPQFTTFFSYNITDQGGQFDIVIIDFASPRVSFPESQLLELTFRPTCTPSLTANQVATVGFGSSPPPSFSNVALVKEEVLLVNGSVQISTNIAGTTTLPPTGGPNQPDDVIDPDDPDNPDGQPIMLPPVVYIPGNQAPLAIEDKIVINEDTSILIDAAANDTDTDGGTLFVGAIIVEPTNGTAVVTRNGLIEYMPAANFSGEDSLVYFVMDGQGGTATGLVNITINPVNDVPIFSNFPVAFSSIEGEIVSLTITAIDQEVSTDQLSYQVFGLPLGATFNTKTGEIGGVPAVGTAGSHDIIVFVSDGEHTGSQSFVWNITPNPSGSGAMTIYLPLVQK